MKEEEQKIQKKSSLLTRLFDWFKGLSIQVKLFLLSFLIMILGFIIVNSIENKDVLRELEESKKRTEEKLKSISLYQNTVDSNQATINVLDRQINNTNTKIEEILKEKPKNSTLDEFFDKRV